MALKVCLLLIVCLACVVTALPRRETSLSKLTSLAADADSTPECGHSIVYIDKVQNGFGAQVMKMVEVLALGILQGSSVHIAVQQRWNYGCGHGKTWDCYFEPPTPLCQDGSGGVLKLVPQMDTLSTQCEELTCDMLELNGGKLPSCVTLSTAEAHGCIFDKLLSFDDREETEKLQLWRNVMRKLWSPRTEIRQSVQAIMEHMNLVDASYVGVHIRRGDKVLETDPIPLYRYAEAIRLLAPEVRTIFAASDDFTVVQDLAELLPEYQVLSLSRGNFGHLQRMRNRANFEETYKTTSKLIVEVELLSRADYFIGTFSSNIGHLIHLLRPHKPETSISLDHGWAPGNAWRGFETKYCDSPHANTAWCNH
eukprot:Plantae.Rhodophyta-Purpureofilum_apyrenoidigerum.ctg53026.p1 GENE.Plantae.Rhodophyta-Purpureofilum_apyrenoidigerum.ctg53026~~Plantae.Rhodophyta-Purpureofilum_apyrenoidigerum.ctg53026.p1  ORF type:complete len:385 (+),score=53.14 Plantae.Rhodophyta-Purpureofilum_apyrenoidigerum.ctg53026:57-1157(+)